MSVEVSELKIQVYVAGIACKSEVHTQLDYLYVCAHCESDWLLGPEVPFIPGLGQRSQVSSYSGAVALLKMGISSCGPCTSSSRDCIGNEGASIAE